MTEENTQLEQRILEQKVVVSLYEVRSSGHSIRHDSPVIGAWEDYGHWKKEHGIHSTKEGAEAERTKIIDEYFDNDTTNQFRVFDENPITHFGTSSKDFYVRIKKLEVDQRDIAKDGWGNMYYEGRKIS